MGELLARELLVAHRLLAGLCAMLMGGSGNFRVRLLVACCGLLAKRCAMLMRENGKFYVRLLVAALLDGRSTQISSTELLL